jgi:hypothetical protein
MCQRFGCAMMQQERANTTPDIHFCKTKYRLTGYFVAASHELMELQNQQMQAVIDQDSDFSHCDDLMHMARKKKDHAKCALIAHTGVHRC